MPIYNILDFHVYLVNARVMMVYILLDQVDISRVLISHNTFKILSGILAAMSRLVRIFQSHYRNLMSWDNYLSTSKVRQTGFQSNFLVVWHKR